MTRTISFTTLALGAAMLFVVPAWGQGQQDAFERAAAANANPTASTTVSDAFERAAAVGHVDAVTAGSAPDAFERMLGNRSSSIGASYLGDHNARLGAAAVTAPASTTASGREIEWPQIGIGIGLGILLALGLVLGARIAKVRPLAH